MHRDLMVGITVDAPWLTRKKTVRGGGSSMALSSAFAEAIVRSFAGSTIMARQPPGLVRLRKARSFRTASTPIEAEPSASAPSTKSEGCAPAAIWRATGWLAGMASEDAGCGAGAAWLLAQEEPGRAISKRRFADTPLAREQPGVMERAGVERAQEQVLGRLVSEEPIREPGMERVGRACVLGTCSSRQICALPC